MVTGQTPFEGDTPFTIGVKHKSETPKPPKNLNSQIPDDLSQVILKCLEKETESRYQNVGELRYDLTNIQKGFPTTERIKPTKRPLTSKEITVQLSPKKLFIPALIIIAIIIAAVAIWQLLPKKEVIKHSIAIISFENQTEDSSHDYLQKIIPNLLITSLEQTGNFKVTAWERMHDLLEQMGKGDVEFIDSDLGFELGLKEEIDAIIVGYFAKAGDVYVTDLKVLDVHTKDLLKSASAKGTGASSIIDTQIDDLSKQISQGFGIPERKIEETLTKIKDVTTSSMEAYDYFLRGNEKRNKLYLSEAQKFYEKAIELDPGFAAAYGYLGAVQKWQGFTNEADISITKAMELSERISEKERLLIEILYYSYVDQNAEKAYKSGKVAIDKFPKNKHLHLWHSRYYKSAGLKEEVIKELKIAVQLDPNFGFAHNVLAYAYAAIEDLNKAFEHWKIYASLSPEDANPVDSIGDIYFTMGRLDESIAQYKKALEIKEDFYTSKWRMGYIYAFKEEYPEAMKWLDDYIDSAPSPNRKKQGHVIKEFLHGWLGQTELATRNLKKLLITAKEEENEVWVQRAYRMLGWIHLERGEFEKSREEYKNWFDYASNRKLENRSDLSINYDRILCHLDLKQGRIIAARSRFEERIKKQPSISTPKLQSGILLAEGSIAEAISVWDDKLPIMYLTSLSPWDTFAMNIPIVSDLVARAHQKQGEIDKAIAEYERLTTFDPESRDRRLIPPKYYYRLAKLYQEKGWVGKAIENYEKFLDLWKDADPIFEEVGNAKTQLRELQNQ
jgi:tetratricopeptide (TPR) repeat protein